MKNSQLKEYKQIYTDIRQTDDKIEKNWQLLQQRLPDRQVNVSYYLSRYGFPVMTICIIFFAVITGAVSAAQPGETLYPVRILSDRISAKITGDYSGQLEKRTDDIIQASGKRNGNIKKAAEAYRNALDETKQDLKSFKKNNSIRKTLEDQEERLRQITPLATGSAEKDYLEESIRRTQHIRQESEDIKGTEDRKQNEDK